MMYLAAMAALLCVASAQIENPSSLQVVLPQNLRTGRFAFNIQHSEALFGIPKYGGFITAPVHTLKDGEDGCEPITVDPTWSAAKPMLLIERGGCHFTKKVHNAQEAGAAAVLIADNAPLCGVAPACNSTVCASCPLHNPTFGGCQCLLPFMNDDGSYDVVIPSFLITQLDASTIKGCMKGEDPCDATHTNVVLKMEWSLPAPDDRVEWSIWSSALDEEAEVFREQFMSLVQPLGQTVQFTPHYFIYNGRAWGCTAPGFPCRDQCTNSGQYCAADPDGLGHGVAGLEVVQENLRQICIFQQANTTVATDNAIRYWRYTSLWAANCGRQNALDVTKACSDTQIAAAGLDVQKVEDCVAASGGAANDSISANHLLENEISLRDKFFIVNLPTIVVNDIIERGSVNPTAVLQTMCNGFSDHAPAVCECRNVDRSWLETCVEKGLNAVPAQYGGTMGAGGPSSGLPGWAVFVIVILVFVVIGLAVGGYVAYQKAHANMRAMLDDYRRLDGEGDDDDDDTTRQLTRL